MPHDLPISARRSIPGSALSVRTARAQGPGGQHVNKTESKVQLSFDPRLVPWIDEELRLRIVKLAGNSVDGDGCILVSCQENREQGRNLEEARAKLAALLQRAMTRPKKRIATKPTRGSKVRRITAKKQRAETKAGRGKVSRDD